MNALTVAGLVALAAGSYGSSLPPIPRPRGRHVGTRTCQCGRVISANKAQCFKCKTAGKE